MPKIISKPSTKEFRDNFDTVFRKDKPQKSDEIVKTEIVQKYRFIGGQLVFVGDVEFNEIREIEKAQKLSNAITGITDCHRGKK